MYPTFISGQVLAAEGLSGELKADLLKNTGFFEGEFGFSTVAGNYDGQGISFGILQFNLGQQSLQPLLKEYIRRYPDDFQEIFGPEKANIVIDILEKPLDQQKDWADTISASDKHRLKPEWHKAFMKMGEREENQQIQRDSEKTKEYFDQAVLLAKGLNINSTQGLAFCFDQAVHKWQFEPWNIIRNTVRRSGNTTDKEKLRITLPYVLHKPPGDGHLRRELIYKGSGEYFDRTYDINKYQELSYDNTWK
ncbi:hypothetical protein BLGI_4444 [Brevibacillus laterosporus GI-9]|nr:hypothetical protein BLGI_4444 [Brevibacillus laterosporus GI-9]